VSLEHVGKRYGDVAAVHDATIDVGRGEFFSLLGPSGCGKTTLLRMIAGFEDPTSGVLRLDGADMAGVPPYRRPVNTVFQSYALFPHLSVFDNVAFGPRTRREPAADVARRVRAMLEVVRLGDLAERKPSQLSGGQRQRVALARALVNDPSALLLDEPLSALDLALRRQMQLELKRIQRDVGIAFVFVTHDQEEALAMSDRIAVMSKGRFEQVGTPAEIYEEPASAFVARFIGSANMIAVTVERSADGRATFALPGGRRGEAPTRGRAFAPGASALLMIRPEHLEVAAEAPADGLLGLPVTCTDLVFQGPVLRVALRDPTGGELVDYLDSSRQRYGVIPGASLWASWEPGAARLLQPDEQEPR
jgi:spermidine/putrescine transport system ATP-binding protein